MLLIGIQASGKSTFYIERFFDTHVRISQDLLRTHDRLQRMLDLCLTTRQPFVLDRVNASLQERAEYLDAARRSGFRTTAYWFDTRPADAIERNARRSGRARVPVVGILGTYKRLVPPQPEERFDGTFRVELDGGGFVVAPFVS